MKFSRYISLLLALVLFGEVAASSTVPARPQHYGRSLPYVVYLPQKLSWPVSLPVEPERIYPLILRVSVEGRIDSVALINSLPKRIQRPVRDLLDSLRFHPGTIDGNVESCKLFVNLNTHGKFGPPTIEFPVDSNGNVRAWDTYFKSIELNGVTLPRIVNFPRFGCYFDQGDSTHAITTSVAAVDLDSTGAVVGRQMLLSNSRLPDGQFLSAILWSKFEPAVVDGIARPSRLYLTASCFPLLNHPNYPMAPPRDSVRSFFRDYQIQVRHDTLGWLLPAIPRFNLSKDIIVHARGGREPFSLRMHVDSAGDPRAMGITPHSTLRRDYAARLLEELKYHPAIDFHGHPIPFQGTILVDPSDAPRIRIEYFW